MSTADSSILSALLCIWLIAQVIRFISNDSYRERFALARAETFTVTLVRVVVRLLIYVTLGMIPVSFVIWGMSRQQGVTPPSTQAILGFVTVSPVFGWLILVVAAPFVAGFLNISMKKDGMTEEGRFRRTIQIISIDSRPAVNLLSDVRQVLAFGDRFPWGTRSIAKYFILCALMGALSLSYVGLLVAYVYAGILYAQPALLPFEYSSRELELLNEQPFFIAFGVAFVFATDLWTLLKERIRDMGRGRDAVSLGLPLVEVLVIGLMYLFLVDKDIQPPEYTTTQAITGGIAAGIFLILVIDVAQAILSLRTADRRSRRDRPGTPFLWEKGAEARDAIDPQLQRFKEVIRSRRSRPDASSDM